MSRRPSRRRTAKTVAKPAKPRRNRLEIEIIVASDLWRGRRMAKSVVKRAVLAAADAISTSPAGLAIVLSDDSAIQVLNRKWRGKNAPTNVLSFPAAAAPKDGHKFHKVTPYIGDVVIAYQTTSHEAVAEQKPFNHHLAHLAVHGFLHLLGYDHEDDRDAEEMEEVERRILRRLGVPDPYLPRDDSN